MLSNKELASFYEDEINTIKNQHSAGFGVI